MKEVGKILIELECEYNLTLRTMDKEMGVLEENMKVLGMMWTERPGILL